MDSKQIGILGEKIARKYLQNKGYQILDKNYIFRIPGSPQKGEIDIVAQKKGILNFIEVKALAKSKRGPTSSISPERKFDFRKQRKVIKTAESWLRKRKIPLNTRWQIDVISIIIDLDSKKAKIRHFKNVQIRLDNH